MHVASKRGNPGRPPPAHAGRSQAPRSVLTSVIGKLEEYDAVPGGVSRAQPWGPTSLQVTSLTSPCVCRTHTCVPENNGGVGCVCHLLMDDVVSMDNYTLDLWAGQQLLWKGSFKPSEHGEQGRVWWAWVGVFPQPPGLRVCWTGEVVGSQQ